MRPLEVLGILLERVPDELVRERLGVRKCRVLPDAVRTSVLHRMNVLIISEFVNPVIPTVLQSGQLIVH